MSGWTTGPAAARRPGGGSRWEQALASARTYADVFRIVKASVAEVRGRERAGVGLVLAPLPASVGAYWVVGGNYIVLNAGLVRALRGPEVPPEIRNAVLYVVLTHEYLHALDELREPAVRRATAAIARATFGPESPVADLASRDLWEAVPSLRRAWIDPRTPPRVLAGVDPEATRYIR